MIILGTLKTISQARLTLIRKTRLSWIPNVVYACSELVLLIAKVRTHQCDH